MSEWFRWTAKFFRNQDRREPRDRTWELLEKHLDRDSFYLVSAKDSAPTLETLRSLAEELACTFPEDFLLHATSENGGVYVEVVEEIWPRPKPLEVMPFWRGLYGLFVYGFAPEIPDWLNIRLEAQSFKEGSGLSAVPFLKVIGDADVYCFTESGDIVRWNHELNELRPIEQSFFEVLDFELAELKERKDRMISERS